MPNIQTPEGKALADALLANLEQKKNIPNKQPLTEVDKTNGDFRDVFNKWIETNEDGDIVDHVGHA